MLPLFLVAIAADAPPPEQARFVPDRQALAVVRIVRPARISFEQPVAVEEGVLRTLTVRDLDGSLKTASLVEFY